MVMIALGGGCVSSKPASSQKAKSTSALSPTDACAVRLHDLCGPLLMYYAVHRALPAHLTDLSQFSDLDAQPQFDCPVSKQPYIYNPKGLLAPGGMGKLIIYDATPAHAGLRWAIAIIEPQSRNAALIARVIAVKNTSFIDR
jgi:hypothetical protein